MESKISLIKARLAQIEEARNKATQGEWREIAASDYPQIYGLKHRGCYGIDAGFDESVCYAEGRLNINDGKFIALAANEILKLTQSLGVAVEALEYYASKDAYYKTMEGATYSVGHKVIFNMDNSRKTL